MESCCGALLVAGGCFGWLRLRARPKKSAEPLPATMRRLVLREANVDFSKAKIEVEEVEVPQPKSGQVLIKVAASPVNPSDEGSWKVPPSQGYPLPLGTEGSGTVVATGGGALAAGWMGCDVIFLGKAYAQYAIADAISAHVMLTELPKDVPVEDACAGYVNPLTVLSMVEAVRVHKSNVFIHTAAASQVGQMLVRYCQSEGAEGATVVNLVRRKEQVAILERLSAKHIIDTSEDGWESKLQSLIQELKIFHAFDCISGDMPGKLLSLLPPGGTVWVYGRLAGNLEGIDPVDFIYRNKKLQGFLVTTWLFGGCFFQGLHRWRWQTKLMRENLKTTFTSEFQDTTMREMLNVYCAHKAGGATGGKIRVRPQA